MTVRPISAKFHMNSMKAFISNRTSFNDEKNQTYMVGCQHDRHIQNMVWLSMCESDNPPDNLY